MRFCQAVRRRISLDRNRWSPRAGIGHGALRNFVTRAEEPLVDENGIVGNHGCWGELRGAGGPLQTRDKTEMPVAAEQR
jgi:hypothetical protein